MRRLLLAGLFAALVAVPAAAGESPTVGSGEVVAGRDLLHWQLAWNRWLFRLPQSATRRATDCLPQEDGSPVRFLALRDRSEHVTEVHCTVAAGLYLMLGQPEIICSDVVATPGFPHTRRGLDRCARANWRDLTDPDPRVVLDGVAVPAGPVVRTGPFRFGMPARGNQFGLPGVTRVRASAVGRATILRPLAPGAHTLILGIRYRGEHNVVVVYKLTVV